AAHRGPVGRRVRHRRAARRARHRRSRRRIHLERSRRGRRSRSGRHLLRAPRGLRGGAPRSFHAIAIAPQHTRRRNTMRLAKAFALTTLLGIALATSAHASEILAEHVTGGTLDLPWVGGFQTSNNVMYGKTLEASDPAYANPS